MVIFRGLYTIIKSINSSLSTFDFYGYDAFSHFLQYVFLENKAPSKAPAKKKVIRVDQEFDDWAPKLETDVQNPNHVLPTYWLLLTRENGNLYIYSIPEMQLVYMIKKFNSLPEVLKDDLASAYEDVESGDQLVSIAPSVQDTQVIAVESMMVKPEDVCF